MFTQFFLLLRARGLNVSLDEWMTFLEALKMGLHGCTVSGFYTLAHATLVKREADFDKFDLAFLEFFGEIARQQVRELPDELLDWLEGPELDMLTSDEMRQLLEGLEDLDMEEMLRQFEERLREQDSEHNGGNKWIGRGGTSPFGNSGRRLGGIRVGGTSRNRSAFMVASERRFRDFRNDETLNLRQFQVAFRKLRQLTQLAETSETELDIDGTVRETGDNAGMLHVVYRKPRKNSIRIMLLIDSGGSMEPYAQLCATLFQAARQSNYFRDVKVYYFHNCVYDFLHHDPTLEDTPERVEDVLRDTDPEYRIIFVGDAMMALEELHHQLYTWRLMTYSEFTGMQRLLQIKERYEHIIWLNPESEAGWSLYWLQTRKQIAREFPMFDLTIDGLEEGIHQLLK